MEKHRMPHKSTPQNEKQHVKNANREVSGEWIELPNKHQQTFKPFLNPTKNNWHLGRPESPLKTWAEPPQASQPLSLSVTSKNHPGNFHCYTCSSYPSTTQAVSAPVQPLRVPPNVSTEPSPSPRPSAQSAAVSVRAVRAGHRLGPSGSKRRRKAISASREALKVTKPLAPQSDSWGWVWGARGVPGGK